MLIGTDRNLLTPGTAVYARHAHLGEAFPEDFFTSMVFSARMHGIPGSAQPARNVSVHATQSRSRLLYGHDALQLAKTLPRPDVVSAQDPFETGLAALRIARHFGVPLALEAHTDIFAPAFVRHSLLNRLRVAIARYVLPRAAGGYAVSATVADRIAQATPRAPGFAVLPIYVDTRAFAEVVHEPAEEAGLVRLLWVGRLEAEKRPAIALRALRAACDAGYEARLTIVGTGRLLGALTREARVLGVTERVTFAGVQKDVRPFYAAADLLLATSAFEGYGMAIVEALAAGVPVLSTDVGIARAAGAVIAEGDYAPALTSWLAGPRARGALTLSPYADERDYLARVRAFYASLVS